MKMINENGEAVYYNLVTKNGKDQWIIKGIGSTMIRGRDKKMMKSRTFTQEAQAEHYLRKHGYYVV